MAFTKNPLTDGTKKKLAVYSQDLENRVEDGFDELSAYVDNKDKKTMMEKGVISNANSVEETGIYATNANTTNKPISSTYGGVLVTLNRDSSTLVQIHIDIISAEQKIRRRASNGTWSEWK